MKFQEKIDKLLTVSEKKFNSIHDLERILGLGMNTLRKAYNENREPSRKVIWKILETLDVNPQWWETGKGEIFSEKPTPVKESDFTIEIGGGGNKPNKIPFFDTVAVGGLSMLAEQEPIYNHNAEMIDPGTWFRQANGALRVYGHSMFPKYPAGCIVAFKESETDLLIWGEDYVIELKDRRIVKRVEKSPKEGYIVAVSYNKSEEYVYSPIEIPVSKIKRIFMVMGKVEMEASI